MSSGIFLVLSVLMVCAAAAAQPQASVFAAPPTIMCAAEGRLPDPTDCSFYIDCTGDSTNGFTYTTTPCAAGTYYDACYGNCSQTAPPTCAVTCTQQDNGAVTVSAENPGVYSLCYVNDTAAYVIVSTCPNGTAFNATAGTCGNEMSNCPASGGSTTATCNGTYYYGDQNNCSVYYYCSDADSAPFEISCPANEYYISYNHTCVGFTCTSAGFFADPGDCTRYYFCDSNNNTSGQQCPLGSYFDSSLGGCRLGNCSNNCPGAGDSSGGGGATFTCPSTGFFADPNNCSRYYFCDSTLTPSPLECPSGSYFDSSVAGCVLGQCTRTWRLSNPSQHEFMHSQPQSSVLDSYISAMLKVPQRQHKNLHYLHFG